MTIFIETLSGSATGFEVYGGLAAADQYLLANADDAAVAYRAKDDDGRKRALIGATRYLDSFAWNGVPTGLVGSDPTTLQFPRTGLTDPYGNAVSSASVPQIWLDAVFEMAALAAADPSSVSNADQGSLVSSLGAGPVNISFFRPTSASDGNATVLPIVVDRRVGRWLASASGTVFGGIITGTNPCSDFATCSSCGASACSCSGGRRDLTGPL